jgi:hypothetical protein
LVKGFSFSSTTLPDTKAYFFWEKQNRESSKKKIVSPEWRLLIFIRE